MAFYLLNAFFMALMCHSCYGQSTVTVASVSDYTTTDFPGTDTDYSATTQEAGTTEVIFVNTTGFVFATENSVTTVEVFVPANVSGGIGKVFIGNFDDNETTLVYSFNENYKLQFFIPIFVILFDEFGDISSDYNSEVQVTCDINLREPGYTNATFSTATVRNPAGNPSAQVPFSDPQPGRETVIQCWGESLFSPFDPQFTKEGSLSETSLFEVRPPGRVNVFQSVVVVPNESPAAAVPGSFVIELSEAAEVYPVTVSCATDPASGGNPMDVKIQNTQVKVGERKTQMNYVLMVKGDPVFVYCSGQSYDGPVMLNTGQFIVSTSQGDGAQFVISEATVTLLPETYTLETVQLTAYLALDGAVTEQTFFACYLHVASNSSQATEIASQPVCVSPAGLNPTPIPSSTTTTTTPPPFHTGTGTMTTDALTSDFTAQNDSVAPTLWSSTTDANATTDQTAAAMTTRGRTSTLAPTASTTTPSTPTEAPSNDTGIWRVQEQSIVFEDGDYYQPVVIERTLNVADAEQQLLVVTCCGTRDENTGPKYINQSAALYVASYLTPAVSINWTDATPASESDVESAIINPAFVDLAPCPCDLDPDLCDIDCCCDQACSQEDVATFTCLPGPYGAQPPAPDALSCAATDTVNKADWHAILCVQWNRTAYLGLYTYPLAAIRDQTTYDSTAGQARSPYNFQETQDRFPNEVGGTASGYKDGISVKTGLQKELSATEYNLGPAYRLTLPRPSLTGQCVWTGPVQYLVDSSDTCVWTLTASLCQQFSPLSALTLAQSDRWSGSKGPLALAREGQQVPVLANVNYLCTDDPSAYIRDPQGEVPAADQVFLFRYDVIDGAACGFDEGGRYRCENQTSAGAAQGGVTPGRCPWDDGYTKPPPPVLNAALGVCSNTVVDVLYNFTWRGQELVYLNATVILADVAMTTTPSPDNLTSPPDATNQSAVLSQLFKVRFVPPLFESDENDTDIDVNATYVRVPRRDQYSRSGNPGYNIRLPVISGVALFNDSSLDLDYVDTNSSSRLALWSAGADGLCYNAGRQELEFGVDMTSSCVLRLGLNELLDCDYLRMLVLNRQDSLMAGTYVSQVGDPDPFNLDYDWTAIFREDLSRLLDNATSDLVTSTGDTPTTDPGRATTASTRPASLLDQIQGLCPDMPSGIHVTVMYAKAGESDAIPFWQVVGAKVSYALSVWQMRCVGVAGAGCEASNGSTPLQSFTLTSSVSYIRVPPAPPKPKTKFAAAHEAAVWQCEQDSCWEEMFYPFMRRNPGDSYQYTLAMGLAALLLALGLGLIMRPVSAWDSLI